MKNLLFFVMVFVTSISFSQDFAYLDNIKLSKKKDFVKHEADLIKAVDFIMSTPLEENEDRSACGRFIIVFASNCPYITVSINNYIMDFISGNEDLLVGYLGLSMKNSINNKGISTEKNNEKIFAEFYIYAKGENGVELTDHVLSLIEAGDSDAINEWIVTFQEESDEKNKL